jgi:hypothetical protein
MVPNSIIYNWVFLGIVMVFITILATRPVVGRSRPAAAFGLDTSTILMLKLAPGRSKFYNLERYGKNNGPLGAVIGSKS